MRYDKKNIIIIIFDKIKSIFLHGFFTLLPIAITFGIIRFGFRLIKSTLAPIYQLEPDFLKLVPHSEILVSLIVVFLLGIVFDLFLLRLLHKIEQKILNKIPLLRQIYFGAKQLVDALQPRDRITLRTVVMFEYPRMGIYSIGFLTNEVLYERFPTLKKKYYSVFMPSVPNPATGHYVIVPETDCIFLDISRHEAIALIISGGIIEPKMKQDS